MLEFHEVAAEDGCWAAPLLRQTGYFSCEYAFVNIFMWAHVYHTQIAHLQSDAGDWVIARSETGSGLRYLFPAGHGDVREPLAAILADARQAQKHFVIFSVPAQMQPIMDAEFPGHYAFEMRRNEYDYIYTADDLADLPGKKYQKKRNHVSRFCKENPDWEFCPLRSEDLPAIRAFNDAWCQLYENGEDAGIQLEHRAIERVFRHYDELCLRGGYIQAGGKIVAFSFGSAINDQVFDTHVEKALYDANGAYNIINREMARAAREHGFAYINREDDLGQEGLRTAKLSYQPTILQEKWTAILTPQQN